MLTAKKCPVTPRQRYMQARAQARAQRRLVSRAAHVTTWWASVAHPKSPYYTPHTLSIALGKPSRRFVEALRLLGWHRTVRGIRGRFSTLWVPPGSRFLDQPRSRGRPRLYD